jgi:hypothetical protein
MRTQSSSTALADALSAPRVAAAADERRPVVLTEAELASVAAAGAKPGIARGCNKEQR